MVVISMLQKGKVRRKRGSNGTPLPWKGFASKSCLPFILDGTVTKKKRRRMPGGRDSGEE